ncbi:MAG: hypothetical protein J6A95_04980 [Clostridia bacterium]|nr:hypothetical protein [Clostridia bacterium]
MAYRKASEANLELDMEDQFEFYLFTKNLQGDILNIYSEDGTKVASYNYDAWGNHTVTNYTSDNIGNINPFRYRGYYFDSETNFYYLNSRYYDPEIKRFISADVHLSTSEKVNSFNLYAYCENSPISNVDPKGESALAIGIFIGVSTIVGGILGAFSAAATGGNVLEGALKGAVTGAIAATTTVFMPQLVATILPAATATTGRTGDGSMSGGRYDR